MIGRTNTSGGGGGGAGLNFRVIGGTSAPSNPRENDIWVNTSTKVDGFIFSNELSNISEVALTCAYSLAEQYIVASGEIVSNNEFFNVTDYVELPKTTTHITVEHSITASSVMCHAFYDKDKNFISAVLRQAGTVTYEVPSGAMYARLTLCVKEDREDNRQISATVDDGSVREGTVLFNIGTNSHVGFNALKKNGIQVYPLSAKQYVSGAWVGKTAKSYQGGAWVDWWDGVICENGQLSSRYSYIINGSTFTQNEDSIELNHSGSFVIAPKVDVTNYSKLIFKIAASTSDVVVGLATTSGDSTGFVASASISTFITAHTLEIDISSLTGEYWIKVAGYNDVVGITINIYGIKLE